MSDDNFFPDLNGDVYMFIIDDDGGAWITQTGSFSIPFRARPINPQAWFNDPPNCGPAPSPDDTVTAEAVNMGNRFRPRWFLQVSWNVAHGVRLIKWSAES